jgi:hypothetical protein
MCAAHVEHTHLYGNNQHWCNLKIIHNMISAATHAFNEALVHYSGCVMAAGRGRRQGYSQPAPPLPGCLQSLGVVHMCMLATMPLA